MRRPRAPARLTCPTSAASVLFYRTCGRSVFHHTRPARSTWLRTIRRKLDCSKLTSNKAFSRIRVPLPQITALLSSGLAPMVQFLTDYIEDELMANKVKQQEETLIRSLRQAEDQSARPPGEAERQAAL